MGVRHLIMPYLMIFLSGLDNGNLTHASEALNPACLQLHYDKMSNYLAGRTIPSSFGIAFGLVKEGCNHLSSSLLIRGIVYRYR